MVTLMVIEGTKNAVLAETIEGGIECRSRRLVLSGAHGPSTSYDLLRFGSSVRSERSKDQSYPAGQKHNHNDRVE